MLQLQILASLGEGVPLSVSDITSRLNRQQPSVSRSLADLEVEGMVRRTDLGWVLTEEGSAEAEGAPDRIREAAAGASRDVSRTYGALTALNLSNPPPSFNASYNSPVFEFLARHPLPQPSPYNIFRNSLMQNPSPTKVMLDRMSKTLPKFDFASTMSSLTESTRQSISVIQQAATQTMGSGPTCGPSPEALSRYTGDPGRILGLRDLDVFLEADQHVRRTAPPEPPDLPQLAEVKSSRRSLP